MKRVGSSSVAVSEDDIRRFNSRWPASNLRGLRGVTFEFQGTDLVDVRYKNGNSDRWDGSEILALSHDAQAYLEKTPQKGPGSFYVSTYCNKAHNLKTGRPIKHECRILPPKALAAEREGDYDRANRILSSTPVSYTRGR